MKIDFSLSSSAELILNIVLESKNVLTENRLGKILQLIAPSTKELSQAIQEYDNFKFGTKSKVSEKTKNEIRGVIYLGLLTYKSASTRSLQLTDEGRRIAQAINQNRNVILRPKAINQTTVFVACAFGRSDVDELYKYHLAPACTSLGYKPIRVDMTEPHQTITEKIMEGITDAACVIADLTYARPSVYFEIGYAVGLGIPLVTTCCQDHFRGTKDDQRVHFDLEQYKISFWTRKDDGSFAWPSTSMEPGKRLAVCRRD
jgi:hypothetical protein